MFYTDRKHPYCSIDVVSYSDYMPFGMQMPNRNGSTDDYRYGFQGQEKDDEVKGERNSVNYKYRMHDPRVGRFFAVDPLAYDYPHNSPYAFSENMVIDHVELEGLEAASTGKYYGSGHSWNAHAQRTKIPNDQMVKYLAITVSPVVLVGAALSAPEWVPAAVVFFTAAAKTPAGKKAVQSTALAFADFLGQLTVNKGDVNKVDMTGIVANYINPFGRAGIKSDVVNQLFQNVFDAAVDYRLEDGFKVVGASGDYEKQNLDVLVDLFVGSLVDNLSAGYKEYIKKSMPDLNEKQISQKLKEFGEAATNYFTSIMKPLVSEGGKSKDVKSSDTPSSRPSID